MCQSKFFSVKNFNVSSSCVILIFEQSENEDPGLLNQAQGSGILLW